MIVLDTHVLVWWINKEPRLRQSIRSQINVEPDIRLSAISMLEIARIVSQGRLDLFPTPDIWLTNISSVVNLRVEPLTSEVCLESVRLPGQFHRDPADRLIVALARLLDAELITADDKILRYPGVRSIAAS